MIVGCGFSCCMRSGSETVKRARERQAERVVASGPVPVQAPVLAEVRIVPTSPPATPTPVTKAAD